MYLIHGLWTQGLHLWIEQVEGHKIVLPEAVPQGTFPPLVESALKPFRHRVRATLQTPKGREVQLTIPTAAYTPEQAVELLSQLAHLDQTSTIAYDLQWLIRMYQGLEQFVRAGRVMLRTKWEDNLWWPQWQLASGMGERGWLAEMAIATPGVISANGGSAEKISEELPHWIATSILREFADKPRPYPLHDFSNALLHNLPIRRGGPALAGKLNEWKSSATAIDVGLTLIVEENEEDWPVRMHARFGTDSPKPIHVDRLDAFTLEVLTDLRKQAERISPVLEQGTPADGGDWDIFLTTEQLAQFVSEDLPKLKQAGFDILLPSAWMHLQAKFSLEVKEPSDKTEGATQNHIGFDQILEYNWRVSLGDIELTDAEMQELVRSKMGLIKLRDKWIVADAAALKRASEYVEELARSSQKRMRAQLDQAVMQLELAKATNAPNTRELEERVEELRTAYNNSGVGEVTLQELRELSLKQETPVEFKGSKWHTALIGGELSTPAPERVDIPETVHAELREYQRRGVDWLWWMSENNVGAVLADDMGLGKTLQLLSLLAVERQHREVGPTLVVCPTSVVGNWVREAARFVPSLQVLSHHGTGRLREGEFILHAQKADLVITSYGMVARDFKTLGEVKWERVVLDEAQAIKNSTTCSSKAVRSLPSRHRVALTGTPVENRLSEMRSILDFCNPGVLGSASFFRNHFAKAIEREQDEMMIERLRTLTAPFILRRLKTDPAIIDDLPEKSEEILTVQMTQEQTALYKAMVEQIQNDLSASEGMVRKGMVLAAITRIKQICNHPAHYLRDGSPVTLKGRHRSGKVAKLMELIDTATENDEKMLIFTQYRVFGDILRPYLSERFGQPIPFLHGGTSKSARDQMVADFQAGNSPAMLLSLKAGGTGLNLTAANVVVHMDRWWNPAVENQATDRAFRIGQDKNVRVYKMITKGTMEESIQDILDGKMHLASAVVGQGEGWITELSTEELAMLMSYRGRDK